MSKQTDKENKGALEKLLNSLLNKPNRQVKAKESYIKALDEAEEEKPEVSSR